jgi:caffeoyl-CoA O-methyltransferase
MAHIVPPAIEEYAMQHSTPESELLEQINRETYLKVLQPHMLSGPLQGAFLQMMVRLLKPRRILELGTYTGYATLCMARAMPEGARLITIDKNEELKEQVEQYLEKAAVAHAVEYHIGRAEQVIDSLEGNFDLVFIDADKANNLVYYQKIIDRVNTGGLIIADNVLWKGRVLEEEGNEKGHTRNIKKFNAYVASDSRVETVMLPLRDGLLLAYKL